MVYSKKIKKYCKWICVTSAMFKLCEIKMSYFVKQSLCKTSVYQMHFIGLPASFASEENAQGFSVFVSFLLPGQVVLHVSFSSTAVAVVLHFVADFWVCDKAINTTPTTRQLTPNTKTKPVKMQTLECRRFTRSEAESLLEES